MTTSSRHAAYVYVQLPGTPEAPGEWVTAGRLQVPGGSDGGHFLYAPSYVVRPEAVPIDPVGLPRLESGLLYPAPRYGGLTDVVRDACPDGWGRHLLVRAGKLEPGASDFAVAMAAANSDRWGALCLGSGKTPSIAHVQQPRLARLDELLQEIELLQRFEPAANTALRKQLLERQSVGGARPKVTLRDDDRYWIAKPLEREDVRDIPALEHATLQLAALAGIQAAHSRLVRTAAGRSVVLVERFDRCGGQRRMTVSGATLLELEYPGRESGCYVRLVNAMRRIGCPAEDCRELWLRMAFNVLIGNDDDHPRNHAVIYRPEERRWRLSPAFDLVPNAVERPRWQAMRVDGVTREAGRGNVLAASAQFGWERDEAEAALRELGLRCLAGIEGLAAREGEWLRAMVMGSGLVAIQLGDFSGVRDHIALTKRKT